MTGVLLFGLLFGWPWRVLPPPLAPIDRVQLRLRVQRNYTLNFHAFLQALIYSASGRGSIHQRRFPCEVSLNPLHTSALHHCPPEWQSKEWTCHYCFVPRRCSNDFLIFIWTEAWVFNLFFPSSLISCSPTCSKKSSCNELIDFVVFAVMETDCFSSERCWLMAPCVAEGQRWGRCALLKPASN